MPYSIRMPNGAIVENIPDDVPKEEAARRIAASQPELLTPISAETQQPMPTAEPKPEDQSFLREVADVPLQVGKGAISGIRFLSDAFGADNPVSSALKTGETYIAGLMSAQSKQDSAEVARIMKEAEDKGVLDQVLAGIEAFTVAPVDLVSNALGTAAPTLAAGVLGAAAKLGVGAVRAGQAAIGAATGAGVVKGSIYDAVKEELVKGGMSAEQAEARATLAQEYGGENLDQILLGTALGGIAATTGIESAAVNAVKARIRSKIGAEAAKETAKETAEQAAQVGLPAALAKGAVKEAAPEAAQAAQEQVAQNIALQREGFEDVPTFRGAAAAATLEGLAGAALGAGAGAIERSAEAQQAAVAQAAQEEQQRLAQEEAEKQRYNELKSLSVGPEPRDLTEEEATELKTLDDKYGTPPTPLAPTTPEERAQQIQAETDRLIAQNIPEDNARKMAETTILQREVQANEEALAKAGSEITPTENKFYFDAFDAAYKGYLEAGKDESEASSLAAFDAQEAQNAAVAAIEADPEQVNQLAAEFVNAGFTPEEAASLATEEVKLQTFYDQLSAQAEDETDAVRADQQRARTTPSVGGEPESSASKMSTGLEPNGDIRPDEPVEPVEGREGERVPTLDQYLAGQIKPESGAELARLLGMQEQRRRGRPPGAPNVKPRMSPEEARRDNQLRVRYVRTFQNVLMPAFEDLKRQVEALRNVPPEERDTALKEAQLSQVRFITSALKERRSYHRPNSTQQKLDALLRDEAIDQDLLSRIRSGEKLLDVDDFKAAPGSEGTIDDADYAASLAKEGGLYGPPNMALDGVTNAQQALSVIAKTGNKFQKLIASRIRNAVANVPVVIIEQDSKLPPLLERAKGSWENDKGETALGLYVTDPKTGERAIFLRGSSFGDGHGMSTVTALHEILHAALDLKVKRTLNNKAKGLAVDKRSEDFMADLEVIMRTAFDEADSQARYGVLPESIKRIIKNSTGDIFDKPNEFLAYLMSDPNLQAWLSDIESPFEGGKYRRKTLYTRFVEAVRKLFGIPQGASSALLDAVGVVDSILGTRQSVAMKQAYETTRDRATYRLAYSQSKSVENKVSEEEKRVRAADKQVDVSERARTTAEAANILASLRDPRQFAKALGFTLKNIPAAVRQLAISLMTNDGMAASAEAQGFPAIKRVTDMMQQMRGMTAQLIEGANDTLGNTYRAIRKDPSLRAKLERIILVSTLAEVDPSTEQGKKAPTIAKMWEELGAVGQREYNRLKQYYVDITALYKTALDDQVNNLRVSDDVKANLMSTLRTMYEGAKAVSPYFPLVRRGQYSIAVNPGKSNREFYLFETRAERQAVLEDIAKRRGKSIDEMRQDGDIRTGDSIAELRNSSYTQSRMLTELFKVIDNADLESESAKEQLKDNVYQLYLSTMPEQSVRRQFIHRQGITGFSTDLMRNFSETAINNAHQLARIKYGPLIRNSVAAAQEAAKGQPKLEQYLTELDKRVDLDFRPEQTSTLDKLATYATRASYIHYLSGASSALLQPFQLISVGFNVLGARHGFTKASKELFKLMAVWNQFGVIKRNADGSVTWVMPSMRYSKALAINAEERAALRRILGVGVIDTTLSSEMVSRKDIPGNMYGSARERLGRAALVATTGLMHTTERMSREIMALTSYRLSRKAGKSVEDAVNQAVADTYEGLGNFDPGNRPPIMRNAGGKVALQFMMFPLYMTLFLFRNFRLMLPYMNKQGKKEAAAKFFGTLGATYVLAGAAGLPGFSMLMGALGAMANSLDDDEKPEGLKSMDFEMWVRKVWLPQNVGNVKMFGQNLSTIIERGPLNALTGVDFSSRLSLNDMWIRDRKEYRTTKEGAVDYAVERAGPFINQILGYMDGYDAMVQGDYKKAIEKFSPALIRNFALSYKYAKEGAKDFRGTEILTQDEVTNGMLMMQAIGFRPDQLANTQQTAFKMQALLQRIGNERQQVLNRLNREVREGADTKDTFKAIVKFNQRFPSFRITTDTIIKSTRNKAMQRALSRGTGLAIDEKNALFLAPVLKNLREEKAK